MNTPTPRTDYEEQRLDARQDGDRFVKSSFARNLETELTTALARVAELENERDAYKEGRDEAQRYFREVELFSRDRDEENKALYSEKESLTRQLSEAQAQLEKQRLILVANQKIMDGAGDSIRALQTQLTSAREALQTACDRMHYIAGAYMALDHGEPFAELEKAIREMGPDMDIVRRASSGHLAGRTETPPREAPVPASTWQPIETAPKDGKFLGGWWSDEDSEPEWIQCVCRLGKSGMPLSIAGLYSMPQVTKWQPLPPPPTGKEKQG